MVNDLDALFETKGLLRRVRSAAGALRFGVPINSVIRADAKPDRGRAVAPARRVSAPKTAPKVASGKGGPTGKAVSPRKPLPPSRLSEAYKEEIGIAKRSFRLSIRKARVTETPDGFKWEGKDGETYSAHINKNGTWDLHTFPKSSTSGRVVGTSMTTKAVAAKARAVRGEAEAASAERSKRDLDAKKAVRGRGMLSDSGTYKDYDGGDWEFSPSKKAGESHTIKKDGRTVGSIIANPNGTFSVRSTSKSVQVTPYLEMDSPELATMAFSSAVRVTPELRRIGKELEKAGTGWSYRDGALRHEGKVQKDGSKNPVVVIPSTNDIRTWTVARDGDYRSADEAAHNVAFGDSEMIPTSELVSELAKIRLI